MSLVLVKNGFDLTLPVYASWPQKKFSRLILKKRINDVSIYLQGTLRIQEFMNVYDLNILNQIQCD